MKTRIFTLFTLLFMLTLSLYMGLKLRTDFHESPDESPTVNQTYLRAQIIVDANTCSHAVVCGGVTADNLEHVMMDPVVKSLYSKLGPVRYIAKTDHSFFAYDSYRIGNKIYWTKKPRFIHVGEPILTDGKFAVLLRCGNFISMNPQIPVVEKEEPTDLYPPAFTPQDPDTPSILYADAPWTPDMPSIYAPPSTLPTDPPTFTSECNQCFSIPIPPGSPTSTPEPSTGVMLILALLGLICLPTVVLHFTSSARK
jgi:hypothetical protein